MKTVCIGKESRWTGWLLALPLMLVLLLPAPSARAVTENPKLLKVGEARLRVLLWSIYDTRLYTPSGRYRSGERPLRLEIEYLTNVRRDALVARTGEEWDAMGRSHPHRDQWLRRLEELWPDIQVEDVLSIELDLDNRSTFYYNGVALGRIEDPDFGQQFIDIWLSEDTTRPALRDSLLGTSGGN